MIQRVISLLVQLMMCCIFFYTSAQDTTALRLRYSSYISASTIQKHLMVLASDSLEGRETAQPGMVKAAKYVAGQFAASELPAILNNTYCQPIPLINLSQVNSVFKAGGTSFSQGKDYFIADAPPKYELKTDQVIFASYGIADSASGWNDYSRLDVKGKTVLIMDGEPADKKGNYLITKSKTPGSWKSDRSRKIKLAIEKKAAAVFFINDDFTQVYERWSKRLEHGRLELDTKENSDHTPVIYITGATGEAMLAQAGKTIAGFKNEISKNKKPGTTIINGNLELTVSMEKTSCTNVLGYVEGSDLKDQVIVISAHLDHLGKRGDKIYYGADDDGSGCSAILAMAEVFARAKREGKGPRRSLLFITFSGEEKGLLGSEYYISNPVFPLENTVANLNIDMIGRIDTIPRPSKHYTYLIGSDKLSSQLHTINESANASCCQLELDYKYNDPTDKLRLYYRSDHYNFAKNNIPVIFYFTGLHEDYHKPTDTIDKIDFEKTAGIVKLIFNTTWELANRSDRIIVDKVNDFK